MILVHPFKEPSNPDRKEIVSRGLRYFAILLIFLVAITGYLENTMISELKLKLEHFCENQTTLGLLLTGVVYTLLLAIPFVPGIELGILILMLFGKTGAMLAYVCTIGGLSLAYLIGWSLYHNRTSPCESILTNKAFAKIENVYGGQWLVRGYQRWIKPNRYLTLCVLYNLPGNMILGGGGGIAMMCGASQQFKGAKFFLATALATSPLPLLVLFGFEVLA